MSKPGGRRDERRLVDMSVPPPKNTWARPSGPTYEPLPDIYPLHCDDQWETQVVDRVVRQDGSGQLVEFAVCLQIRLRDSNDAWIDVVRVDTAHGELHVDTYPQGGNKVKDYDEPPLSAKLDADRAHSWALDYVMDPDRLRGWF